MTPQHVSIETLPNLPRDADGPVFNEPWEAQAFALAVHLSDLGYFTWSEWATALSQEILAAQAEGDPDLGDTYYRHWLKALERMCTERQLVSGASLDERKALWQRAYLNTPHGQPVELAAARGHDERYGNDLQAST